jgi:hypothetical protein
MSEEHKAKTREMIAVMQAYVDGQEIELRRWGAGNWFSADIPMWNLGECDYRIAQTPDSIDWSHVAPEWKYMARDNIGRAYFFEVKPVLRSSCWAGDKYVTAEGHASYKRGTVDWKDSLVTRPEGE